MIKLVILIFIIAVIPILINLSTTDYDRCYTEMENEGYACMECCCGVVGGTSATEYLSESCLGCPYLVLGCNPKDRKEEKDDI